MNKQELAVRTRNLGLSIIRLIDSLPRNLSSNVIARQIVRSATSVGANYRAACRAKSRADFISKLKIVEEEADETLYWLDLLVGSGALKKETGDIYQKEADEILSIIVASLKSLHNS